MCPSFTAERDLAHPDPDVRQNAVGYLRGVMGLAGAVGAPMMIAAPTVFLRSQPIASEEWGWAVESIRAAGKHAASVGVDLTLECWNRYGTFLLNRFEQAARLWREAGLSNGDLLADTYHVNIEERSLPEAIRMSGELLNHVHLSGSNRAAPGLGHVGFAQVLQALLDIGYPGYLTFELDPRAAVRSGVVRLERLDDPVGYLMERGIEHLRHSSPSSTEPSAEANTPRRHATGSRRIRGERGRCAACGYGLWWWRARAISLVGTGFLLLALYGGLDAAGVGEGHMLQLVDATGVIFDDEGAVDNAPDPDRRDVSDAHGFDVLSLPPAAQIYPVGVDGDDVIAARRRLGYRWYQTFSILFVPSLNALTITRKNPEEVCPGAFRREQHWPGAPAPGRCGCHFPYAVPSAGLSNGSGIVLPFPFW